MARKFLSLILYPALADSLQPEERESLKTMLKGMEGVDTAQLLDAIAERISRQEMESLAAQVPENERQRFLYFARLIASANGLTEAEQTGIEELKRALNVTVEGVDFDIPDAEINEDTDKTTFEAIARKFSMIAGAVGFLPTPLVSDFAILAPLQVYMVNRIAKLYDYPADGKELIKMVIGTVGLGYACAVAARGILAFVPMGGWVLAGGIAFAGTYAIAIITQKYIEQKGVLTEENIKTIYKDAYVRTCIL